MKLVTKHALLVASLAIVLSIPLWIFVIAPRLTQLSSDFAYNADLISFDNLYDVTAGDFVGKTQSDSEFSYHVVDVQPGVVTIKNTFNVRTSGGDSIVHIERLYGVSPTSRRHVIGFGDHDRFGYLFAPQNLRPGEDFTYWHVNYDVPAEMHYIDREIIDGLATFHYRTTLKADQTETLNQLPHVGETLGINVDATLDVWVEPTTGWLIKYTDRAIAYYYDLGSTERLYPWNSFSNAYTDESISTQVAYAQQARTLFVFIHVVVPWILLGFLFLFSIPLVMNRFGWFDRVVRKLMPFIITLVGVGLSVFGCVVSIKVLSVQNVSAFESDAAATVDKISDRLDVYRNILDGAQSVLAASDMLSREEWKTYISGLNIEQRYPGIQGVGYIDLVSAQEKAEHEARVRAEGFDQYAILPAGDRDMYAPVVYIEPFDSFNQAVFGYDMFFEATLRDALESARDSGAPTLSGRVTLAQQNTVDAQAGFLLYLPYYGHDPVYTVSGRRQAIQGYVYAPFLISDFIQGIFSDTSPKVAFNIYDDSTESADGGALYISQEMNVLRASEQGAHTMTHHVFLFGHRWKIIFAQLPSARYTTTLESMIPLIILGAGVGMSLLIGSLLYLAERGFLSVEPKRHSKAGQKA